MNELDPEDRDILYRLIEDSGAMADVLVKLYVEAWFFGARGDSLSDAIKSMAEAE